MGNRRFFEHFDWIGAILLLFLGFFGLFLLLTIGVNFFWQQLFWIIVAMIATYMISRIHIGILWWFAPFGYVFSIFLLILSYFAPAIRGANRWIFIGSIQFQPSELVKPLLLLAFARFITMYPPRHSKYIPLHIGLFIIPFLLVFKQPDLGSSMVYASFWLGMLVGGGLSLLFLLFCVIIGIICIPLGWHALADFQKMRIHTFLDPMVDPKGAGYNALQAMIAVGSGWLFGKGLGLGTQSHLRFLPEFHTDFIFATLIEELGFMGGIVLFIMYALLLWRILLPLLREVSTNVFPFVYAIGLFMIILTQVFINVGMNMGILPITGITLPFVSYGGSSILSLSISFGMLWAMRRNESDGSIVAIR